LKVLKVPDVVVVHPVRPAAWGVSLRQQRKSQFDALLFKKHPALYRRRIRARPPLDYYGMVLSFLAACGFAAVAGLCEAGPGSQTPATVTNQHGLVSAAQTGERSQIDVLGTRKNG
jgi:hypothetical protein